MSPNKRKELVVGLCRAIAALNNPEEVAEFLLDILSAKENETIAKRLRIAELLVQGYDYEGIRQDVGVGYSTIARVNTWLNLSGKGYRLALQRKKKDSKEPTLEEKYDPFSWHNYKRRYTLRFWPELLLEELIKQSNKNEKEKIKNIFEKLKIKSQTLSNKRNKELYENFTQKLKPNK